MAYHETVLAAIGHTPLVRLQKLVGPDDATVLVKLEYMNPGGSIKDRMAVHIIEKAERAGVLRPGSTIVENTSGNTGVGVAMAAAVKGYRCVFTMPDKMSKEKQDTLKAFGAQVIVTPTNVPADSPDSYYSVAKRIAAETPNSFYLNQYHNPDNVEAHYQLTGAGDLGADRRPHRRLRGRPRHGRDHERLRAVLQGARPADPQRRRRPGRLGLPLDVQDREALAAPRLQGGGHRRGHDVRGDGPLGPRRRPAGERRAGLRDGAPPRPRGGDLRAAARPARRSTSRCRSRASSARARWWWCRSRTAAAPTSRSSSPTSGCATTASRSNGGRAGLGRDREGRARAAAAAR